MPTGVSRRGHGRRTDDRSPERLTGDELDLLSDDGLNEAAAGLEPGSSALLIVWENLWAGRLARSIRESKGKLVTLERIPRDTVLRAIAALEEE